MRIKELILKNLSVAYHHADNAYNSMKYLVENENSLNDRERNELYAYGIDKMKFDLIKVSNIKKAIKSVTGNVLYRDLSMEEEIK